MSVSDEDDKCSSTVVPLHQHQPSEDPSTFVWDEELVDSIRERKHSDTTVVMGIDIEYLYVEDDKLWTWFENREGKERLHLPGVGSMGITMLDLYTGKTVGTLTWSCVADPSREDLFLIILPEFVRLVDEFRGMRHVTLDEHLYSHSPNLGDISRLLSEGIGYYLFAHRLQFACTYQILRHGGGSSCPYASQIHGGGFGLHNVCHHLLKPCRFRYPFSRSNVERKDCQHTAVYDSYLTAHLAALLVHHPSSIKFMERLSANGAVCVWPVGYRGVPVVHITGCTRGKSSSTKRRLNDQDEHTGGEHLHHNWSVSTVRPFDVMPYFNLLPLRVQRALSTGIDRKHVHPNPYTDGKMCQLKLIPWIEIPMSVANSIPSIK
jgi:hypothetical protein